MKILLYALERFFYSVFVLVALSAIVFFLFMIVPGDPARTILGPRATKEQVENLRHKMKLDEPLPAQYLFYMSNVLHGNFGVSMLTRRSVNEDIKNFFPATLELVIVSMVFIITIGIPLGILSAGLQGTYADNLIRFLAIMSVVTPEFVAGILFQLIFGYGFKLLPVVGRLSYGITLRPITNLLLIDSLLELNLKAFGNAFLHILLPAISLALPGIGQVARITRSNMISTKTKDYIVAARALGIHRFVIATRFLLKPSFIPTLTILGLIFASLFGNCFLVEMVFAWPGLAKYGVNAILEKDLNAIVGVILTIGFIFIVTNFLVGVIAGVVDPRIRLGGKRR